MKKLLIQLFLLLFFTCSTNPTDYSKLKLIEVFSVKDANYHLPLSEEDVRNAENLEKLILEEDELNKIIPLLYMLEEKSDKLFVEDIRVVADFYFKDGTKAIFLYNKGVIKINDNLYIPNKNLLSLIGVYY